MRSVETSRKDVWTRKRSWRTSTSWTRQQNGSLKPCRGRAVSTITARWGSAAHHYVLLRRDFAWRFFFFFCGFCWFRPLICSKHTEQWDVFFQYNLLALKTDQEYRYKSAYDSNSCMNPPSDCHTKKKEDFVLRQTPPIGSPRLMLHVWFWAALNTNVKFDFVQVNTNHLFFF